MENTSALASVNFQHSVLTKGEQKKRSLGRCTVKAAPSSQAKIHSGKKLRFLWQRFTPSLQRPLCLPLLDLHDSKHDHLIHVTALTQTGSPNTHISHFVDFQSFCFDCRFSPRPPTPPPVHIYVCVRVFVLGLGVMLSFLQFFFAGHLLHCATGVSPPPRLWKMGSHEKAVSFKT